MHTTITGKGIELTPAIEEYVHKKIGGLEKFYDKVIRAHVTVGVDNHHRLGGSIFQADCKLEVPGKDIFGSTEQKDLYAAIDALKEFMESEVKKHKVKHEEVGKKDKVIGRETKEYKSEE
jgi:putative sigma-54 modulation protein